jgi:aminoglycoside 3-N-acetyltransferase
MVQHGFPAYDDAYGAGTPYARLVELDGQVVVLGAPLETVTLVHHAEAIARVPGKHRVSYGMPVNVDGERLWRTFSDIDTSEGALPYERVPGEEDYIDHIARLGALEHRGWGRQRDRGSLGALVRGVSNTPLAAVCWRTITVLTPLRGPGRSSP